MTFLNATLLLCWEFVNKLVLHIVYSNNHDVIYRTPLP